VATDSRSITVPTDDESLGLSVLEETTTYKTSIQIFIFIMNAWTSSNLL
jgi:hypothetical protein